MNGKERGQENFTLLRKDKERRKRDIEREQARSLIMSDKEEREREKAERMERERKEIERREKEEERQRKEKARRKQEEEARRTREVRERRERQERAEGERQKLLREEREVFAKRGSVGHSPEKERLEKELEEDRRAVAMKEMKLQEEVERLQEEGKRKRGGVTSEGTAGVTESESEEEGAWRQVEKRRRPDVPEGGSGGLLGLAILEEFLEERNVKKKMAVALKNKLSRAVGMLREELGKKMGGDNYYKGKYEAMVEVVKELGSEVRGLRDEMRKIKEQGDGVAALRREVAEMKRDMGKLGRGKFETREEVMSRGGSYADKVRVAQVGLEVGVSKRREMILIDQEEKEEGKRITGEEVRRKIVEVIDPVKEGVRINWMRKTRAGGVIMEVDNKESADKIKAKQEIKQSRLTVETPRGRPPKLIIYDLPRGEEDASVKEKIFGQNGLGELGAKKEDLVVIFKTGDRQGPRVNWVCEASPLVRRTLMEKGRVYLDYFSVNVADYVRVTRCFKCQEFGHIGRACRAQRPVCGHCAREGHEYRECPDRERPGVCPNCRRAGRSADHRVQSEECPIYKLRLQQEIGRTNYLNGE